MPLRCIGKLFLLGGILFAVACSKPDKKVQRDSVHITGETFSPSEENKAITGVRPNHTEVTAPFYVPLKRTPVSNPAHTNVRPAGKPVSVVLPTDLPVRIPGQDSFPAAETFIDSIIHLPVEQPGPQPALPPRIKPTATYDLQYLDVDQGLLSSYNSYLMEDSRGYLWISSSYGISRYDGNNFLHFTAENGLPKRTGSVMLEDREGNLWFGMQHGVCRYNGLGFAQFLGDKAGVQAIAQDSTGKLWLGTNDGLFMADMSREPVRFTHYTVQQGLSDNVITSLTVDPDNQLWIGTRSGLNRYDGTGFTVMTTDTGLTDNHITALTPGSSGQLWIGTRNGLNLYRPAASGEGGRIEQYTRREGLIINEIKFLLFDSRQRLWIATSRGLTAFDGREFTQFGTTEGLNTLNIRTLLEDQFGNIWLGTGGNGVNRLKLKSFRHLFPHPRVIENGVMALEATRSGDVWLGTGRGAVLYQDSSYTYFSPAEGLIHMEVLAIHEDRQGNTWFGTPEGVSRYDGKGFTQYSIEQGLAPGEVNTIIEDDIGRIWIGTSSGLSCLEPNAAGGHFTNYYTSGGLISDNIQAVYEDSQSGLWICTRRGISYLQRSATENEGAVFYSKEFLPGIDVRTVVKDRHGYVWLGTVGEGLFLYAPREEKITQLTMRHGLSDNTIWSLREDQSGNIWISTERGLTRIELPEDPSAYSADRITGNFDGLKTYTFFKEEGLQKLDFQTNSACLDGKNRLWWGSVGATMLDLDNYPFPPEIPDPVELYQVDIRQLPLDYRRLDQPRYLASLSLPDNLPRKLGSVIPFANYPEWMRIPFGLNHLTFHFAAIEGSAPQKIRFQYYLEGLEQEWSIPSRQTSADYRNLPQGSYTFHLRAGGEDGRWSDTFSYDFTVRPPWWQTSWAYLAYFMILVGIVYGVFSDFRRRLLLNHQLEMQQQEANRLMELNTLKTSFFTNVSHELRTPLSLLLAPVKTLLQGGDLNEQQVKLLEIVRRSGKQLELLVNQILDLRKLEIGKLQLTEEATEVLPFFRAYLAQFESLAHRKQIEFNTSVVAPPEKSILLDREKCRQILFNLLSNAFKYTPPGGKVAASINLQEEQLEIVVRDTGTGIHPDDLPRLFDCYFQTSRPDKTAKGGSGIGLAITREYVQLFGGQVRVESELGQGAVFKVKFPVRPFGKQTASDPKPVSGADLEPTSESLVPEAALALPTSKKTAQGAKREKPTLLVVEDNPDLQDYIHLILSEQYQVLTADNGLEALQQLTTAPECQLVISDLMMPMMDGFQLLEKLKSTDETRHLPVIMLTARADIRDKLKALRLGVDDYLIKPFDASELLVRIGNLLQNQAARRREAGAEKRKDQAKSDLTQSDLEWLESFETFVKENLSNSFLNIPLLAGTFAMSESTLLRQVKRLTGLTPVQYIQEARLGKARQLLEDRVYNSVGEVAAEVGYDQVRSFSRIFQKRFGKLPSELI